ncbi:MAG: hypothetical protein AABY88_04535 [Pseudomonadota bacterium]
MESMSMIVKIKENWFWPLAIILVALAWDIGRFTQIKTDSSWEYAVVFDVLVTLPILYFVCYRKKVTFKHNIFRIIALQCTGIWLATKIVPIESQSLLPYLSWLRFGGLAVLFVFEAWIMLALIKLVFRPDTTADQIKQQLGAPAFVAKLILLEARFWRWVFSIFKR